MATSATHAPQHILNDKENEVLVERYTDLKIVDDVNGVSCHMCGHVLIQHAVANCGHLFCSNCQNVLSYIDEAKCPECSENTTHVGDQDGDVEENVFGLMAMESGDHTKEDYSSMLFSNDTNSMEAVVDPIEMMSEMNGLMETITKLKETQDYFIQKIKEMDDKQCLENEIRWKKLDRKINKIRTDFQHEIIIIQSETDESQADMIKVDLNTKLSKIEETENHNVEEIEQVREMVLQFETANDNKVKHVNDNQRRWMDNKERWKDNSLAETTKLQMQTKEECYHNLREMEEKKAYLKNRMVEM